MRDDLACECQLTQGKHASRTFKGVTNDVGLFSLPLLHAEIDRRCDTDALVRKTSSFVAREALNASEGNELLDERLLSVTQKRDKGCASFPLDQVRSGQLEDARCTTLVRLHLYIDFISKARYVC